VPLLRLLRLPLAPTAAADAIAGYALAGGGAGLAPLLAAFASICLYCGGMAQNDLCDRGRDAKLHPHRPLVLDKTLVPRAYALVAGLFAAGLVLAGLAGSFAAGALVAVGASAYNLGLKARFPADAVALGLARALNVGVGVLAAGAPAGSWPWGHAAGYAIYIASVTGASRAEDLEPRETRRLALVFAGFGFLAAFAVVGLAGRGAGAVFVVPAVMVAGSWTRAFRHATREATMEFVRTALLTIFVLHGAALWEAGLRGWTVALLGCAAASLFLLAFLGPRAPTSASTPSGPGSAP